jgi:hypothetical protein
MACRATRDPTGQQADGIMELKEFGTMTADLLALSDWLAAAGTTHVAAALLSALLRRRSRGGCAIITGGC